MGLSPSRLQSTRRIDRGALCGGSQRQSPHTTSIHILDDYSLLHVFYLYRPCFLGEGQSDNARLRGGDENMQEGWVRGRWWYRLAHVCQRWRNVLLDSASYLDVSLVCTTGTPVADMLAHSPPLPLVIDYLNLHRDDLTAEDEEGIILALKQRDRVRRVRLRMSDKTLQKLLTAMDEEYPILEYLVIMRQVIGDDSTLIFPETLQAPHLRHLTLAGFTLPIGSRLLATAVGLVTLYLTMVHPSTYFHPNTPLQWISSMPQLETLVIGFAFAVPNREVEEQLAHTQITTPPITIPNLRHFRFQGASTYLEALAHRITAPRLEKLEIYLFNQLAFSVPRLLQFMNTAENLRFQSAKLEFLSTQVNVRVYPRQEAKMHGLLMTVFCWHLDWQVSSMAHISNSLGQMFSTVEYLTLEHETHGRSSEEHNEVDGIEWRKLLRPFSNVKALRVAKGLVEELSRCLQEDDGELSLELLPELQELTYSGSDDARDAFTSFVDARRNAGRPITLVHSSNPTLI